MSEETKCSVEEYQKSADSGARFLGEWLSEACLKADCICHRCIRENKIHRPDMPQFSLSTAFMILCPICGNKRCPKASDHRNECTGSNEPGQEGSVYQ